MLMLIFTFKESRELVNQFDYKVYNLSYSRQELRMKTITNIEMFPVSFDGGSWQETLQR